MEPLAIPRTPRRARRLAVVAALAVAPLALAGPAQAGCFATAGLPSNPEGMAAGSVWTVDLTIRQHGETPLAGATPTVILTPADGAPQRFDAQPTAQIGVYRADVTLPPAGTYALAVEDGFEPDCESTHTFGSVSIAGAGGAAAGGDPPAAEAVPVAATVEAAATVAAPPADAVAAPSTSDDGNAVAWLVGGIALGAAAVVAVAFALRRMRGGAGPRSSAPAGS